jgi:hypothetical protein
MFLVLKSKKCHFKDYYAFTLNGTGAGVKYSYSPCSYTKLVSTIFKFLGPDQELLSAAKTIILNNEKQQSKII